MIELRVTSSQHMESLGALIAQYSQVGHTIFLHGELGAGKTTFARGFIQHKGQQGMVKSPTYAIVEEYNHLTEKIFHFDLYRLQSVIELDAIGFSDYFKGDSIALIEWPQLASDLITSPWVICTIHTKNDEMGRTVSLETDPSNAATLQKIKMDWTLYEHVKT